MISATLIVNLSCLAVFVAVWAIGSLVMDFSNPANQAIRSRVRSLNGRRNPSQKSSIFNELSELTLDSTGDGPLGIWHRLLVLIEQSGSQMAIKKFLILTLLFAGIAGTVTATIQQNFALVAAISLAGAALPYLYLCYRRNRRLDILRSQLPEAFDLMRRAVKAGRTMQMAMQMVAKECPPLIAKEFARCCEQHDMGLSQEITLRELARRNDIMEFRIFVVAMLVQRVSGGNPVELLDNLSVRIRKRKRLIDRVKALTSEGRMQALILYVLPIAAFIAIYLIDRKYAQILIDRPQLIGGLIIAQIVGALWIHRIVNFEY